MGLVDEGRLRQIAIWTPIAVRVVLLHSYRVILTQRSL